MENLAKIFEPTEENLVSISQNLNNGGVVGFPTETVYGLGANALNIESVKKIFEYKGRPLSDPLIVHVTSLDMALDLIDIDNETLEIFKLLSDKFWPGPLTMVLKANFNKISRILTAGTDYIGIRIPTHPIARKLIDYSGVPIAAPSANKFCHISPVNPLHVLEDFKEFPIKIIDGGVCNYRMESTVVKIISEKKILQVLRMGAISPESLKSTFDEISSEYKVELLKIENKIPKYSDNIENLENLEEVTTMEAPGQFVKHYSPKLETFIYSLNNGKKFEMFHDINLQQIVFLDYKKILFNEFLIHQNENLKFLDLSESGDANEVMLNLYDYLHQAENIENRNMIVICDLNFHMEENPHKGTLIDRINKSASGKKMFISSKKD